MSQHGTAISAYALVDLIEYQGQTITYTPKGGSAVSRSAIWSPNIATHESDEGGQYVRHTGNLTIALDATTGVASPAHRDKVTIEGRVYTVEGTDLKSSDKGFAVLQLESVERTSTVAQGYERERG